MFCPDDPDGLLARVLSVLPLSAPFAMPLRFAIGNPAWWEMTLAVAIMLPSIAGVAWLAGRIYAGAVLSNGRRVNLLTAFRSARETV